MSTSPVSHCWATAGKRPWSSRFKRAVTAGASPELGTADAELDMTPFCRSGSTDFVTRGTQRGFDIGDAQIAEVEHARSKHGICTCGHRRREMLQRSCTA